LGFGAETGARVINTGIRRNMIVESDIIDRVVTYVRHPVFERSDKVMEDVLLDLKEKADSRQISPETHRRLRELILQSPHFRDN